MDVEGIAPGANFAQTIDNTLADCSTVLVVIGPKWLPILLERAKQGGEDYVRHEIEAALKSKINVIPVLVAGATAAELSTVPGSLADLPFHQAVELHDSSFSDDCDRLARACGAGHARRRSLVLIAVAALIVVAVIAAGFGFHSFRNEQQRRTALAQQLATAHTQTSLDEFEAAYRTATQAAKSAPSDPEAFNAQADAAMKWLENFSVLVPDGEKADTVAAPLLTELMQVLDAALARTAPQSTRAAGILAHIGWAHWLNSHIAEKEFGPAAEQALRQSLAIDPKNVYANAMLGNWLLQNNRSLSEAVQHFSTALATGQERPLVRDMQLGGMLDNEGDGVRDESLKVLNEIRKNHEPIRDSDRTRFLSFTFDIYEAVPTSVPAEEAWQTYLWLDTPPTRDPADDKRLHDLIHARIFSKPAAPAKPI